MGSRHVAVLYKKAWSTNKCKNTTIPQCFVIKRNVAAYID